MQKCSPSPRTVQLAILWFVSVSLTSPSDASGKQLLYNISQGLGRSRKHVQAESHRPTAKVLNLWKILFKKVKIKETKSNFLIDGNLSINLEFTRTKKIKGLVFGARGHHKKGLLKVRAGRFLFRVLCILWVGYFRQVESNGKDHCKKIGVQQITPFDLNFQI